MFLQTDLRLQVKHFLIDKSEDNKAALGLSCEPIYGKKGDNTIINTPYDDSIWGENAVWGGRILKSWLEMILFTVRAMKMIFKKLKVTTNSMVEKVRMV